MLLMNSMSTPRRTGWWHLVMSLLAVEGIALGQSGCAHGPGRVTGRITPEHFRFKTVVAVDTRQDQPDGWRAVCISARITEGDSGATDVCKFEVGLPIRNTRQREVPLEVAQWAAASVANEAGLAVLSGAQRGEMMAVLCHRFKRRYQQLLAEVVEGARVSQCEIKGLEVVYFDLPGNLRADE